MLLRVGRGAAAAEVGRSRRTCAVDAILILTIRSFMNICMSPGDLISGFLTKSTAPASSAGGLQLRVAKDTRGYYVKSEGTAKIGGFCPAVDVLFDSVGSAAR